MSAPTILVVDDEPVIRMAVADHLRDSGFLAIEAGDAGEAITVLETVPAIALVFSDVRMPGACDGIGLARWLAAHRPGLPVILATGDLGRADATEDLGGVHVFLKPYGFETVTCKVRELLER